MHSDSQHAFKVNMNYFNCKVFLEYFPTSPTLEKVIRLKAGVTQGDVMQMLCAKIPFSLLYKFRGGFPFLFTRRIVLLTNGFKLWGKYYPPSWGRDSWGSRFGLFEGALSRRSGKLQRLNH